MSVIILGFGSNIGNRQETISKSYALLNQELGKIIKCSEFITTKAWGFQSDNLFVNSCAEFQTKFSAIKCLHIINSIESRLGRIRHENICYEDRTIDIDILFYDNNIINTKDLVVPHPLLHLRDFVLIPLKQIEPYFVHPVLKIAIKDICLK